MILNQIFIHKIILIHVIIFLNYSISPFKKMVFQLVYMCFNSIHCVEQIIAWRRKWQPTPVFLPGGFHGQTSLAGYSLWPCKSRTRLSNQTTTRS